MFTSSFFGGWENVAGFGMEGRFDFGLQSMVKLDYVVNLFSYISNQ